MKFIIFILLIVSINCYSQVNNSTILTLFKVVEVKLGGSMNSANKTIDSLIRYYNRCDSLQLNDRIFDFFISENYILTSYRHRFFSKWYELFSESQKSRIKEYIMKNVGFKNEYFFNLVSLYQVKEYQDFLKGVKWNSIEAAFNNSFLLDSTKSMEMSKDDKYKWNALAVYYALEDNKKFEDSLLNSILNQHNIILTLAKDKGKQIEASRKAHYLYYYIIPNTINLFYTKSVVIKSIKLIDVPINLNHNYTDVGLNNPGEKYLYDLLTSKINLDFEDYFEKNINSEQLEELLNSKKGVWNKRLRE